LPCCVRRFRIARWSEGRLSEDDVVLEEAPVEIYMNGGLVSRAARPTPKLGGTRE